MDYFDADTVIVTVTNSESFNFDMLAKAGDQVTVKDDILQVTKKE